MSHRHDLFRGWCDDSGASAVEFAVIVSVMLFLVFGIIEFSRYFWTQNLLQFAVEETARKSLTSNPAGSGGITDCSTSVATSAIVTANLVGLSGSSVTVTLASVTNTGASFTAKSCQMTVTYPFDFLGFLGLPSVTAEGLAAFPCADPAGTNPNGC